MFNTVKDWERISMAYRANRQFTCERCGSKVKDGFDHQYMQTHHRNGNKCKIPLIICEINLSP
ncbi:MAG: hypothetical protein K2H60_16705 [Muribaculaceae bacterium]|nr:hypothetical protein [Muribaculaceae bacterium]